MYTLIRENLPLTRVDGTRARRSLIRPVSSTVVLLGLTSMFTDISSEMVAAILPLYLVFGLGLSPLAYGVIDGSPAVHTISFAGRMGLLWVLAATAG